MILTDRPEVATWLTPEEKALAEARIKAENAGSGVTVEKFKAKAARQGIFSWNTAILAFQFLWVK
jgi:hypothetical protein